jgi:hypothetical protein
MILIFFFCMGDFGNVVSGNLWRSADFNIAYVNGNVGIGTASTGFKLEVNGDTRITGSLSVQNGDLNTYRTPTWYFW